MSKAIRRREGAGDSSVFAPVTPIGYSGWNIGVDGPTDHEVQYMSGSDPGEHEYAKNNIADGGVAEILEALCYLQKLG
jgi:hypothetical protein